MKTKIYKTKIYKNLVKGDTREITFHGKSVKQLYTCSHRDNALWVTISKYMITKRRIRISKESFYAMGAFSNAKIYRTCNNGINFYWKIV